MDTNNISAVFEMENTAVSPDDLAGKIAATLEKYPLRGPASWPEFALTANDLTAAAPDPASLHAALEQAVRAYDQIWVTAEITPSRWPFVTRVKKSFHQLVIFYVNRLGERQIKFNDRILRAVNLLAAAHAAKDVEITRLRQRLTQLENQLDQQEHRQR